MSVVLLIGLGLNALFGWWWADAVAALIIAGLAVREGIEAWRGDACSSAELLFEEHDHKIKLVITDFIFKENTPLATRCVEHRAGGVVRRDA